MERKTRRAPFGLTPLNEAPVLFGSLRSHEFELNFGEKITYLAGKLLRKKYVSSAQADEPKMERKTRLELATLSLEG